MTDLQVGELGEIPEGVVGQHADLVVAQVPERQRKRRWVLGVSV